MRNWIKLNGNISTDLTGLLIQELPPISKPQMRTQRELIDGRDGDTETYLGYAPYDKPIKIGLSWNYDIDAIIGYFANNRSGVVVFSNEPDKQYRYTLTDQIDFERLLRFRTATVKLHAQPYKYKANETPVEVEEDVLTDTTPYLYRISADGQNIGSQEFDEIVGGTVAWNQIASFTSNWSATGGTYETLEDKTGRLTASASGQQIYKTVSMIQTHVYFCSITFKTTTATTEVKGRLISADISSQATTEWQTAARLYKRTSASGGGSIGVVDRRASGFDMIEVKNPMHFDLTLMLGSTIADYIYSLENAHTGDGVAYFKSLFPNSYYAYDSGTLMSVQTSEHKMVGFNQWDEVWELGGIVSGVPDSTTNKIRSKNFIPVIPNTQYYCKSGGSGAITVTYYDSAKTYIRNEGATDRVFTTPTNCCFLKFACSTGYGTTYNRDICINISDASKNGTYEPYISHSYPLDSSLTLRGIPKLVDNKLYYDGDIYQSDGTVTRKYGVVDLGTLTWSYNSTYSRFDSATNFGAKPSKDANTRANAMCSRYESGYLNMLGSYDKFFYISHTGGQVRVVDSSYSDSATFKSAMSGVYLVYELATSTTETATPYTNPQIVAKGGTEEYVDTRDVPIPVGHNTSYPPDIEVTLTNEGNAPAKPIITVYGTGVINIYLNGDQYFTINMGPYQYVTIDTEGMNATSGGVYANRAVTGDYSQFSLPVGTSVLKAEGATIVQVENVSRWY